MCAQPNGSGNLSKKVGSCRRRGESETGSSGSKASQSLQSRQFLKGAAQGSHHNSHILGTWRRRRHGTTAKKTRKRDNMETQVPDTLDPRIERPRSASMSPRTSVSHQSAPHTFRFLAGCLRKKRFNFHSQQLERKLTKLANRVQPEATPYTGLIISPTLQYNFAESFTVRMKVFAQQFHKPVSFSCPAGTKVGYLIDSLKPFLGSPKGEYVFKVTGYDEYLSNESLLSDYEHVCACKRLDKDIWLTVVDRNAVSRNWQLCTREWCDLNIECDAFDEPSFDHIKDRVLSFESIAQELVGPVEPDDTDTAVKKVCESVKNLCALLKATETADLYQAVADLRNFYADIAEKRDDIGHTKKVYLITQLLEELEKCIAHLIYLYSSKRAVDFQVEFFDESLRWTLDASHCFCPKIKTLQQLQKGWVNNYDTFRIISCIVYGERAIARKETRHVYVTKKFFSCASFEETLSFKDIPIKHLPREARLYLTVMGLRDGHDEVVGWTGLNLFLDPGRFNGGEFLLGLWPPTVSSINGPASGNENNVGSILLSLPYVSDLEVPLKSSNVERKAFTELDAETQNEFVDLMTDDLLQPLNQSMRTKLWEHRHHLCDHASLLPHFLSLPVAYLAVNIRETYALLDLWNPLTPEEALALFTPSYPDSTVRKYAVQCLQSLGSDELSLYLPHLVESLKYECWDDSHLALFLLQRARTCVRLAHQLYWLLKCMVEEPLMRCRVRIMIKALAFMAGEKVARSVRNQMSLDSTFADIALKVKNADTQREETMRHGLMRVDESLQECSATLPFDPALSVGGIDVESCCVFPSKTLPMKIVFRPTDTDAEKFETIYKVGDDLRQDMFILNLIQLMDKLWLESGLDLRMLTFKCTATGKNRGILEAVRNVSTLRYIQTEHLGITGSFNTRTIADWLLKQHPDPANYHAAIENFVRSCAGCCVATYILGVGDRHNDNILLATSGHMLHIDFGKVLGKAETLGGIRRDRAPVALTPDMVYVIRKNGSDTQFIRLCCDAYNVLRRNAGVFLSLFKIMTYSGIGDVTGQAIGYLRRSMSLDKTDAEAARHFEKRIRESVATLATSINFLIHNIASLGHQTQECAMKLSFNPKEFSMASEGRIVALSLEDMKLRYHPERYYVFVVRVTRQFPPAQKVMRTYKQFLELYGKMSKRFVEYEFYPLSRGPVFGSESDEALALKRKKDIALFLDSVMAQPEHVKHYKLMYSFFHPLPKDTEAVPGAAIRIVT
ncbi:phosphatidylinositol 4-phosphate 3-kinase C2 domain-containing subunit alpha-like isoform X2 [Ornithodoros turicata]|uniref:phosphatidylinositol 4-phosphate 3-kinase C2 domain-containing subunit alpha-like isoform X2 n=2 Tax=Ornithodoros turicata TaxID=34597 RepID=UPI0031386765